MAIHVVAGATIGIPNYTMEIVPDLEVRYGNPVKVNDRGDMISGDSVYSGGEVTKVEIPGVDRVFLTGINNRGQVVGHTTGSGPNRGFIWEDGSVTKWLPAINGEISHPTSINEKGDVVGWSASFGPFISNSGATLWTAGGETIDLGTVDNDKASRAYAINDRGQIAGYSQPANGSAFGKDAFLWEDNLMQILPKTTDSDQIEIGGLNNFGHVVGWATERFEVFPFIWDGENTFQLKIPGDHPPSAINDAGLIIGGYGDKGFVHRDGEFEYLRDLIEDRSEWREIQWIYDINERGQIVGVGELNNRDDAVFLLTPVQIPEPSSVLLFLVGNLGLLLRRRRCGE